MRVFFAHPKSMPEAEIESWASKLTRIFRDAEYSDVTVIPGRDDFQQYAPSAGGFSGWTRDVATRRDAMTQKPYYEVYVSPYRILGKATADILTLALHEKRTVILAEELDCGDIELHKVHQVVVDDPEDYLKGWWLDT